MKTIEITLCMLFGALLAIVLASYFNNPELVLMIMAGGAFGLLFYIAHSC